MTDVRSLKGSGVLTHRLTHLLLASLILVGHQAFYYRALGSDAIDDAYISFRYAQNLVAGEGLVFNPGERVEGYTNFLWTITLSGLMYLGFEPSPASIALGMAFSVATLWLVYVFLTLTPLRESPACIVAGLCLATDGSYALWAVSGMETSMFAFLVLACLTVYLWEWDNEKPGFFSGVLCALAAITRPEGVLVLALIVLHQAVARAVLRRRLMTVGDVVRVCIFLGLYLPYFLWRYYYYGFLLPNTFYAKVTVKGAGEQHQRGLKHLRTFMDVHLGWLLPVLTIAPFVRRRFSFWSTCLVGVVVTYVSYIVYVGGDWSVGRFFVPILPLAYILVASGVVEAYQSLRRWLREVTRSSKAQLLLRGVAVTGLIAGLAALFGLSSLKGEYELFVVRYQAGRATQARIEMGRWLRDNVPTDTFIAVDAAGQVPYYSGLRTLDMFGVNDIHTAHLKVQEMGKGVPGHEKFDFDYIMWRRPDLIIASAPFLDGSELYQRMDVPWTDDAYLRDFLCIYSRKGWTA